MYKLVYRAAIISQGLTGNIVLGLGYPPNVVPPTISFLEVQEHITSLNTAIARGMSFLRRFQANGFDVRLEVLGRVVDDNNYPGIVNLGGAWDTAVFIASGKPLPATPIRAILDAEVVEQIFARIDTPDKCLTTRIALANRSAITGLVGNLGGDFLEDTEDRSTLLLEGV